MSRDHDHAPGHKAEAAALARSLAVLAAEHHEVVEAALVVRLGCGFCLTISFAAGEAGDIPALLERALAAHGENRAVELDVPGRTLQ